MEAPKMKLPPISSLMHNIPTLTLPIGEDIESVENNDQSNLYLMNGISTSKNGVKTPQYTLEDDLMIFKTINSYYGTAFHGRVPWSFWQTFRKVTGNERSSSSLYHHWNGAMRRKYGAYLTTGRLHECIAWIEQALAAEKSISSPPANSEECEINNEKEEITGLPLHHNWSLPPKPIEKIDGMIPLNGNNRGE